MRDKPKDLNGLTSKGLAEYYLDIHRELCRIESSFGNVSDWDWDMLEVLEHETARVREAQALLATITLGEARKLRPTLKNNS